MVNLYQKHASSSLSSPSPVRSYTVHTIQLPPPPCVQRMPCPTNTSIRTVFFEDVLGFRGNAMHAVRTQCEVLNVGQYSHPTFGPFDQFLVPYWGFFSLLCSWDVAHLNCHPLLPNLNHFYPYSIPHIELSPLWGWGPREGRGDVAIHSPRTLRSLWYGLHPHHITDLARHQQVFRVHAQNHHCPPLHPIHGPHHPRDHGQRIPRAQSQGTPHRRLQKRSHRHRNTRSKRTLQG